MSRPTCRNGHRRTAANTHLAKNAKGYIIARCLTCRRAAQKKRRRTDTYRSSERDRYARGGRTGAAAVADSMWHGTVNGYNRYRCRCPECRAAIAQYHRIRKFRKQLAAMGAKVPHVRAGGGLSLDAIAAARYGMDRIVVGTVWDDPTADAALTLAEVSA